MLSLDIVNKRPQIESCSRSARIGGVLEVEGAIVGSHQFGGRGIGRWRPWSQAPAVLTASSVALFGVLAATSAPADAAASPHRAVTSAVVRADYAALAQALKTGRAVLVASQTTPTTAVVAHPDGQLELISNALPVRVRSHGLWVPLNTRLRRDADGSFSAPLTAEPVSFSGGGRTALEQLTDPATGLSVSMYWPSRLPAPQVSGSVALYRNVMPGVDLRLQVNPAGAQETLVIRDRAAAAKLRQITYILRGSRGVTLRPAFGDSTQAVDAATGRVLFTVGQSVLWYSGHGSRGTASASRAGSGAIFTVPTRRAIGASRSTMTLTLALPAAARTGRNMTYPAYVDPEITDGPGATNNPGFYYSEVANFGGVWNSTTGTTSIGSPDVEVGYCGYSDCLYDWNGTLYDTYIDRDYFEMSTLALEPHTGYTLSVSQATFSADEVGNSDGCTAQSVALYGSTASTLSKSTDWPGPQGSEVTTVSSAAGGGSGCKAAVVDLNATTYVSGIATQGSGAGAHMVFELRAPSETNELQYKVFTDNPSLDVFYQFTPN
jgi:hypothetical protein